MFQGYLEEPISGGCEGGLAIATVRAYIGVIDLGDELLFARQRSRASFQFRRLRRLALGRAAIFHSDLKGIAMTTGIVKFFNATKGFGFIEQGNGQPDVFVHISAVERAGMRTLVEGQKLNFEVVKDNRNGKSAAENLQAA